MKVSVNWLQEYVDLAISPQKLIEIFNNLGIMVNTWEEKDGDFVLDVETYTNRPDTLGHLGIARELSTALGYSLKEKTWPMVEGDEDFTDGCDIQIWEEDLCPRYCGIIIKDVHVGPSPPWLVEIMWLMLPIMCFFQPGSRFMPLIWINLREIRSLCVWPKKMKP